MAHKFEQSDSGNDLLRARFTLWLNTALIRARRRYLETHTEKLDIVPLDEVLTNTPRKQLFIKSDLAFVPLFHRHPTHCLFYPLIES